MGRGKGGGARRGKAYSRGDDGKGGKEKARKSKKKGGMGIMLQCQ